MKTLTVDLPQNAYKIFITSWDLDHSVRKLKALCHDKKIFIVTNTTIKKLYARHIQKSFSSDFTIEWLVIPDGERFKTLATCEKLYKKLSQKKAHRKSALLALGGGVVGDIAGFVAATYMRGIDYFQMPTTLLSQVDSSVGGKTGVDLPSGKNLVGAFYQPKAVFIHTAFLKTLPARELRCGLAEVIKYGVIWDAKLFAYLKKHHESILKLSSPHLSSIIQRCCAIKARVVKQDEKEHGLRAILNFGHSLGHAIEWLYGFKRYKHGEAVAMGMCFAAHLSLNRGLCTKKEAKKIPELVKMFDLPVKWPGATKIQYKKALQHDKKSSGLTISFIALKTIGQVEIIKLKFEDVTQWL